MSKTATPFINKEQGQSLALINVLVIVGLVVLAFIMSNYGMLTIVRRMTQTGADAAVLAAADYLADHLTVTYVQPCPRNLNDWKNTKEKLTQQGIWTYYLNEYYLKYLQFEDFRWKNEVDHYLGYHQSSDFGEPVLSPYSPGHYFVPEEIMVVVGAKGDSPLSAPQYYGTSSIEVHAEAAALFTRSDIDFPGSACSNISEQKGYWRERSESYVRNACESQASYWESLDNGLAYNVSANCDVRVYEQVYKYRDNPDGTRDKELDYEIFESTLRVDVQPQRTGIAVEWESKGLRLAP